MHPTVTQFIESQNQTVIILLVRRICNILHSINITMGFFFFGQGHMVFGHSVLCIKVPLFKKKMLYICIMVKPYREVAWSTVQMQWYLNMAHIQLKVQKVLCFIAHNTYKMVP